MRPSTEIILLFTTDQFINYINLFILSSRILTEVVLLDMHSGNFYLPESQ